MQPTLLLTRPADQSERFAASCRGRFGDALRVVVDPVLEIRRLAPPAPVPAGAVLAFTSENAVRAFAASEPGAGRLAHCVGDRTAEAAREAGFRAASAGGGARELVAALLADPPDGPILYLRGTSVRLDVAGALRAAGLEAEDAAVYEQAPRPLGAGGRAALKGPAPVLLPLFSPRSAELVSKEAGGARAALHVGALSADVAAAWTGPAAGIRVAERPDAERMLDAVGRLLRDALP